MLISARILQLAVLGTHVVSASPLHPAVRRQPEAEAATHSAHSPSEAGGWSEGATLDFPVHDSCNATEKAQLSQGLEETVLLAQHARDHVLRFGNSSDFYPKYFGAAPTAEVIGWYEKVIGGDRGEILFRCDDPDDRCKEPGYGGYWRGTNATNETNICELSFEERWYLPSMCAYGYTVAGSGTTLYWASDLLHRLYHTSKIGEDVIDHYADEYAECLELAVHSPAEAVRNSATLRYFALDAYAYDVALPGEGCTGAPLDPAAEQGDAHGSTSSADAGSMAATPEATPDATPMTVAAEAASITQSTSSVGYLMRGEV